MKAIITLAAGLMIVSATFAQSSRRSEVKENNTPSNNKSSESVSTERRSSSDSQVSTNTSNRRSGESRSSESVSTQQRRTSEPASENRTQTVNDNRRTNDNPPSNRRVESNDSRPQGNGNSSSNSNNVSNRRHVDQNDRNGNSNSRVYDNRREPSKSQVVVHEHNRPVERHHSVVHKSYRPVPVEVRRVKYPYRVPVRTEVIWTLELSRRYEVYYPHYHSHHYHVGTRIATISAYDAYDFVGEIARVYGRVSETYYSWETDEYFLYLGDYYPYQDFTVIIPGREAREFSRRPERFFEREYIEVTGLVSRFQGKPEMIVRRAEQIGVY